MNADLLVALIPPTVTASLAALGVWLQEARLRHDRETRRRRALTRAKEEVSFLKLWVELHEQIAEPDAHQRAVGHLREDLVRSYDELRESLAISPAAERPITLGEVWSRLLMLQARHDSATKVARFLYWLTLAWALIWAAAGAATLLEDELALGNIVFTVVAIALGTLPFALPARALTNWLSRRQASSSA